MELSQFVALVTLVLSLLAVGKFAFQHFACKTDFAKYGAKQGAWALVTGARDGIGRGFAVALAAKGFNVALVARNEAGLKSLAAELESKYKVSTLVIAADANATDAVATIAAKVASIDLRVLVNNVGVNTELPTNLVDTTDADVASMIGVNVSFTTLLTRALIPKLQSGKAGKRSLIYCLSSFSGVVPVPMMAVYSATKAYNDVFARALAAELKPTGIDVKSVVPHYVVSAMSGFSRPNWAVPDAVTFAKATLNQTGFRDVSIAPHWFHDVTAKVAGALPDAAVGAHALKTMQTVRAKLIRRAEKAKAGQSN